MGLERVLLKFIERDGQATPDAVLFAARLKDRATGSRKSLRRTLQELEKRATAMLKEPTAWPLREEERTWKDLERKLQELPKKDTRYQRWSNSEFYVREPAENLGPNPGLVEGTPIGANRGVQPKAA